MSRKASRAARFFGSFCAETSHWTLYSAKIQVSNWVARTQKGAETLGPISPTWPQTLKVTKIGNYVGYSKIPISKQEILLKVSFVRSLVAFFAGLEYMAFKWILRVGALRSLFWKFFFFLLFFTCLLFFSFLHCFASFSHLLVFHCWQTASKLYSAKY